MKVVRHDAVAHNRMIVMERENFFPHDVSEFRAFQPPITVGGGDRQRNDMVVAVKDLVWKVVSSSRHS